MAIRKKLEKMMADVDNNLQKYVCKTILENESETDIQDFCSNVLKYGCQTGFVSSLVWFSQTHAFFDEFYEEIEDLLFDAMDETDYLPPIKGDLKNTLAWFGYEVMMYKVIVELNFDA